MMLCSLSAWHAGYSQIVVGGDDNSARPLQIEVARHYLPFAIVIPISSGAPRDTLSKLLPFTAAMPTREAAAYVCRNFTCRQPATSAKQLEEELRGQR
jgi:uncharacterized protein YyaL (SSP411 family)